MYMYVEFYDFSLLHFSASPPGAGEEDDFPEEIYEDTLAMGGQEME